MTDLPRTVFFASTASVTKEKTRCVGGVNTESLCALILVKNTLLKCLERAHVVFILYPLSIHSKRVFSTRIKAHRLSVFMPPTRSFFSFVRLAVDPKKPKLFLIQR